MPFSPPSSLDSPLRRPAAALAITVAVILLGDRLLSTAFDGLREGSGDLPGWLPQFGSVGETVVFYATLSDVLTFVVLPAILVWLGYAYGRSRASSAAE